jgi:7-cyano-7-deazaguanine synthase in queuosine biosynthesis
MISHTNFPVVGIVRLIEKGTPDRKGYEHTIVLGDALTINTGLIERYFCAASTSLAQDLMTVVGVTKYADRNITRHHASGWGRSLTVEVPVFDIDLWSSTAVQTAITDCLNYLTGDEWHFNFTRRRKRAIPSGQMSAPLSLTEPYVFIPYSHGLDSYAQLRILQQREPSARVVCVHTDTRGAEKTWKQLYRKNRDNNFHTIPIPVSVDTLQHGERSFRTRPFTYYLLAAYGAILHADSRVLIPENGQGSLGGSLVTLGAEAPHRSCHPGFTHRLTAFIYAITDKKVTFEHPALFQTKGEVLSTLFTAEPDPDTWLKEHWSCSHDHRHASVDGVRMHCGVCGNCILRRVSIKTAGLTTYEKYKYADLTATTLDKAVLGNHETPRSIHAFEDLARNSVRSMNRLAELATMPDADIVWAEAATLGRYRRQDATIVHTQLMGLLKQHREEWKQFLSDFNGNAWITKTIWGQNGN